MTLQGASAPGRTTSRVMAAAACPSCRLRRESRRVRERVRVRVRGHIP